MTEKEKEFAKLKELYQLSKPLIKFLRDNFTAHDVIVITNSNVTVSNGGFSFPTDFGNWDSGKEYESSCGYPVAWGRSDF